MHEQSLYKIDPIKYTVLALRDMARLDKIFCDAKMEIFGTKPSEKLMKMSERFASLNKSMGNIGLHIENGSRIRLQDFKKTVNFKSVFKCLASEEGEFDAALGIENGTFRSTYLNEMPMALDGHRICLSAYPSSGNSLLRAEMEYLTGLITGSDAPVSDSQQK